MKLKLWFCTSLAIVAISMQVGCAQRSDAPTGAGTTVAKKSIDVPKVQDSSTQPSLATKTVLPPTSPRWVKASAVSSAEICLTWISDDADLSGFIVERNVGDAAWKQIATTGSTEATYSDKVDVAPSTKYNYRVMAFSAGGISSPSASMAVDSLGISIVCPVGFVRIPANPIVGVKEMFCVMKYEAKIVGQASGTQPYNPNFIPQSTAASTPWVNISREQAADRCKVLGKDFDLITNSQWQAVARNIEGMADNWSGLGVGSGSINRGHSELHPAATLAASTDEDPCFGTGNINCLDRNNTDYGQKRTHRLSTGETIWDISGNVFEWVKGDVTAAQGADSYVSQMASPTYDLLKWGAAGKYETKTSGDFGGLGKGFFSFTDPVGAIVRGGGLTEAAGTGIFTTVLQFSPTTAANALGFRCVMNARVGG